MNWNPYTEAQTKFHQGDFEAALQLCNRATAESSQNESSSKELKLLEADCLLELKQARLASKLYEELQCYSQSGFAAILSQDLNRASKLYKQAPLSAPTKWGNFLLEFLKEAHNRQYSFTQDIKTPGYLTFRLYFEVSFSYFLHYGLHDYVQRFLDYRKQLINTYPEIIKDMGSAHLTRQDYQLSLEYLSEAKNYCYKDAGIHFKSAVAYMALKKTKEARDSLLIVKKMLPGSELIERLLKDSLKS